MLKSFHSSAVVLGECIIYEIFSLINLWNVLKTWSFYFFSNLVFFRSLQRDEFALWCAVSFLDCHCEIVSLDSPSPVFSLNHYLCQCLHSTCRFSPSFVLQLHTDLDKGDSSVKYTLSGDGAGSIFTIDQTTGDIHALRSLDREEKPYYTLRAQAVDIDTNIPLEPESEFVIKVQDINDNEPKFLEGPYTASVPEMSPVGKWPFKVLRRLFFPVEKNIFSLCSVSGAAWVQPEG